MAKKVIEAVDTSRGSEYSTSPLQHRHLVRTLRRRRGAHRALRFLLGMLKVGRSGTSICPSSRGTGQAAVRRPFDAVTISYGLRNIVDRKRASPKCCGSPAPLDEW